MSILRRASRPFGALMIVGALGLVACGSDDSGEQLPPPLETGETPSVSAVPDSGSAPDTNSPAAQSDQVLGTGNVGGTVVDPKPHPIDGIDIAESYPEQLMVRFTGGDSNCTAADAVATATGSTVIVTLEVGITEDALSRSCQAGDFEQTVSIALDAGLDGREVFAADI
jgi:hypothetical protein